MVTTLMSRMAQSVGRDTWLVRTLRPLYETALCAYYREHGMPWVMNGVPFRVDPRHRCRMGEERVVFDYLRPRLPVGGNCLVLGANAGLYAVQLAHHVGPKGKIVAFEPNPTTAKILERHVAMNGFTDRITVVQAAVGASPGRQILFAGECSMLSRLGDQAPEMAESRFQVEVAVTTVDEYCRTQRFQPDWITMDIEGFEFAALEGARETFRAQAPRAVTAEFHPDLWRLSGFDRDKGTDVLNALGLRVRALTGQSDPLREFGLVALEPAGTAI